MHTHCSKASEPIHLARQVNIASAQLVYIKNTQNKVFYQKPVKYTVKMSMIVCEPRSAVAVS